MKKLTFLILLSAAFIGMSAQQLKTDSLAISKATLSKSRSVMDLDKNLPKNAKIQSVEVAGKVAGKVRSAMTTTAEWSKDIRNIIDSVDIRTKMYIDFKFSVPPDEKVQSKSLSIKVQ
jgi:hypothetical protein